MKSPIVILGAGGLVGQALSRYYGERAISLTHGQCDIADPIQVRSTLEKLSPAAVFNCAAMANVDLCEQEKDLAFRINADAVGTLAKESQRLGFTLIHFSTDSVFNGKGEKPFSEDQPLSPISTYGESKAKGEVAVLENTSNFIIARTTLVFGKERGNFVRDCAQKLQQGEAVQAASDQIVSTSYAADVARMTATAYERQARGILHVVNSGFANRVEIAQEIASQLKIQNPPIIARPLATMKLPARRPLNCRLSLVNLQRIGIIPPPWQDALRRFLKEL